MSFVITFISALLFGLGLGISGMTNPSNIIGFLDIFGDWKPALILVMGGAIGFHAVSYYLIRRRASPIIANTFKVPSKTHIDARLVIGSALFGIGWAIGGFCPGPAFAALITSNESLFIFIASMCAGIALYHYLFKKFLLGEK